MNGNTPLSEIKTSQQLMMLLVSQGWQRSPTRGWYRDPDGSIWFHQGQASISAPCWEVYDTPEKVPGNTSITLHPGVGEHHGEVDVIVEFQDGHISEWVMYESYAGTWSELDPTTTCLNELAPRLKSWMR